MGINLRNYQVKCVKAVRTNFERDVKSQLIVLPTGTGKTVIFVRCILDFSWPTLVIVHRDELAKQAIKKLIAAGASQDDIGVVMGDQNQLGRKITIGSVQTLSRSGGKRLDDLLAVVQPKLIVIDEAHHAAAKSYQTIIRKVDPTLLLGFTATPMRQDKKHLIGQNNTFNRVVFRRSIIEMVMSGFLVPPHRKVINTGIDIKSVGLQAGDYNQKQLGEIIDDVRRHKRIVESWLEFGQGRKTIVFAVNVANAEKLTETFINAGIDARVIHGGISKTDRVLILDAYARRDFDVLVNCEILTEGFDDPETDCILMARPTLSESLYIQMLGRALRLFAGKVDALIIDVTDNSTRHSIGFQDIMPEAKDPHELLREMPKAQLEFFKDMQKKSGQRGKTGWFTGDPEDFESMGIYHDPHFRWIKYGDMGYSLTLGKGESVHIILGELTGNAVAVSSTKEWIVEHPIAPEFTFAVAEQWAMERAKQLKLKRPYGWTEPNWWDLNTTDKQMAFAKQVGAVPGKTIAETSYRIDEKTLRSKFTSILIWLERGE